MRVSEACPTLKAVARLRLPDADVDPDDIGSCQLNLTLGRFPATPLHPAMPSVCHALELISILSVFTHLREAVTKNGAILLLFSSGNAAPAWRGSILEFHDTRTLLRDGLLGLPEVG